MNAVRSYNQFSEGRRWKSEENLSHKVDLFLSKRRFHGGKKADPSPGDFWYFAGKPLTWHWDTDQEASEACQNAAKQTGKLGFRIFWEYK